jgi:hypothetical protein
MTPAPRLAALLVLPALALGGCGQSAKDSAKKFDGDQKAVAQAVEDLQSAGTKHDAKKICNDLLAPALVTRIKQASNGTCDAVLKDALSDADAFELQVQKVTVNGDTATAVVESQSGNKKRSDTLELQKVGNSWRIATLGGAAQ